MATDKSDFSIIVSTSNNNNYRGNNNNTKFINFLLPDNIAVNNNDKYR